MARLWRTDIIGAAIGLIDGRGVKALSTRRLGTTLVAEQPPEAPPPLRGAKWVHHFLGAFDDFGL